MYNSLLRDREVQYIALRDETSKTWRILDTWNEALKELDMDHKANIKRIEQQIIDKVDNIRKNDPDFDKRLKRLQLKYKS